MLEEADYETAHLGRWHLGMDRQSQAHNQDFGSYFAAGMDRDEETREMMRQ